ncbi:OLC1v1025345C1 [Oldenlandia corymbosa var. corymbosa]|uniref:OLC1v1025345C1 n=1 Tax=Oldenlandia corymbosa var. corymbosa TaxID=529605 RepID=A0AAV1C5D3_OLDCO|nr:OLC1v1025345C1 [Oldenlandia corymbosa var. corymbosa]
MEYEVEENDGPGIAPECGAIFMSNTATKRECFRRNILAFPSSRANFVKQIKKGLVLFLFENEKRQLFGVYRATSDGGMNISPHPFIFQGKQLSWQVSFAPIWECDPLSENEFCGAIRDNYYTPKKFNFGLSQKQVHRLLSLFEAKKLPPRQPHRIVTRTAGKDSRFSIRERLGTAIDDDNFPPIGRNGFLQNSPHGGIEADDNMLDVDYKIGNGGNINYSRGNLLTDQVGDSLLARKKLYDEYTDYGVHDSHIPSVPYKTDNREVSLDKGRPSGTYCRSPFANNYGNDCSVYVNRSPGVGTNYSKAYPNANRREEYGRPVFDSSRKQVADNDRLLGNNTIETKLNSNGFRRFPDDHEDLLKRPGRAIDSTRLGHGRNLGVDGIPAVQRKYYENFDEYEIKGTSGGSRLLMDKRTGAERNLNNGLEFSRFSEKSQNLFESHQGIDVPRRLHRGAPLHEPYEPSGYDSRIQRQVGGDFQYSKDNLLDDRQGGGDFTGNVPLSNSLDIPSKSFLDFQYLVQNLKTPNSAYHDPVVTRVNSNAPERTIIPKHSPAAGFDQGAGLSVDTPHYGPGIDFLDLVNRKPCQGEGSGRSIEYRDIHFPSHDSALPFTAQVSQGLEPRFSPATDGSSMHAPSNYGSLPFPESYPLRESPLAPENRMLQQGLQEHDQYQELSNLLEPHFANEELGYDKWCSPQIQLTDLDQRLNPEHVYSGPERQRKSVFSRLASHPRAYEEANEKDDVYMDGYMDASVDEVMEMLNFRRNVPQKNFRKSKPVAGRHDRDETVRIGKRASPEEAKRYIASQFSPGQHDRDETIRNGKRASPERAKRHEATQVEDESSRSIADSAQEIKKETRELEFKRRRDLKNGLGEDSAKSNISSKEDNLSREKADSESTQNSTPPTHCLQMQRPRRRHRYGAQICALFAAVLLLLSVSLLHNRLNFFHSQSAAVHPHSLSQHDAGLSLSNNPLLDDSTDSLDRSSNSDDLIDEHDDFVFNKNINNIDNVGDLFNVESEEDADEEDDDVSAQSEKASSLYYFDHLNGVVRRGFNKKTIEEWEDYISFESKLGLELGFSNEGSKTAFGSDDIPVNEKTRKKLTEIQEVEDALLLKGSKLREGWGEWFDKKIDFLRRDRMFKSNLEGVNPLNNPLLQDPDMPGVTGLTRGDKVMQKGLLHEFQKVPFLVKKPLAVEESKNVIETVNTDVQRGENKKIKGKTLDRNLRSTQDSPKTDYKAVDNPGYIRKQVGEDLDQSLNGVDDPGHVRRSAVDSKDSNQSKVSEISNNKERRRERKNPTSEFAGLVLADGRRWGYYPGLDPRLSFNNFMESFFRKGRCSMRIFMVWNSAPWMFGVRHQRGLESVFFHHRDACVVVFTETLELNFFSGFVEDGYKVAVAMPNLDELLKNTPTHIFASVWHEWKKTRYYPLHYSELIRLAALYKYGGIYLDSDIIILQPLSSLNNTVGMEEKNSLNGAVMAFRKHSGSNCIVMYG